MAGHGAAGGQHPLRVTAPGWQPPQGLAPRGARCWHWPWPGARSGVGAVVLQAQAVPAPTELIYGGNRRSRRTPTGLGLINNRALAPPGSGHGALHKQPPRCSPASASPERPQRQDWHWPLALGGNTGPRTRSQCPPRVQRSPVCQDAPGHAVGCGRWAQGLGGYPAPCAGTRRGAMLGASCWEGGGVRCGAGAAVAELVVPRWAQGARTAPRWGAGVQRGGGCQHHTRVPGTRSAWGWRLDTEAALLSHRVGHRGGR